MIQQVHDALADAFHLAFLACAVVMAVVIALGIRDLPPLTVASDESADEQAALAHQSGIAFLSASRSLNVRHAG